VIHLQNALQNVQANNYGGGMVGNFRGMKYRSPIGECTPAAI
jgi:hypothetical protein